MLLGIILSFFKTKKIGKIIFAIGLLFYSLFLISISINNIKNSTDLYHYIQSVSSSFILSIIVGTLITLILQSSSIFIAILQILATGGLLTIYQTIHSAAYKPEITPSLKEIIVKEFANEKNV